MEFDICEIHGGEPTEVEYIGFCGEHVRVCPTCLQDQTGKTSKAEFQKIEDDSYYVLKTKLLDAAGK